MEAKISVGIPMDRPPKASSGRTETSVEQMKDSKSMRSTVNIFVITLKHPVTTLPQAGAELLVSQQAPNPLLKHIRKEMQSWSISNGRRRNGQKKERRRRRGEKREKKGVGGHKELTSRYDRITPIRWSCRGIIKLAVHFSLVRHIVTKDPKF